MKKQGEKGNQPLTSILPPSLGSFSPIKSGLFKCVSVFQLGGKCLPKRRDGRGTMLHGCCASSRGRIPEEDVSSAGTHGRSILVQTQQGLAQASKIPPQQSQGLLAGAPGEHHARGSSSGKSR